MKQPRYRQLADDLRAQIAQGVYKEGDLLPTELELCAGHNVSRHTARDALRILTEDGLITRRRGAGTIVAPATASGPFSQDWGEISDILQYARDVRFVMETYAAAAQDDIQGMGLDETIAWMAVSGLRQRLTGGPALALTSICVRADLMPAREIVETWPQAIGEYLALHNGVRAARIDQTISAVCLNRSEAKRLDEPENAPALRTLRRYCDGEGAVFLASVSLHPADRFAYRMSVTR
jgi:GntR family transcriptional regulator